MRALVFVIVLAVASIAGVNYTYAQRDLSKVLSADPRNSHQPRFSLACSPKKISKSLFQSPDFAPAFLRRFTVPGGAVLAFFFMGTSREEACRDSPRQDSPFVIPCHALDEPRAAPIIGLCFWIPEQN